MLINMSDRIILSTFNLILGVEKYQLCHLFFAYNYFIGMHLQLADYLSESLYER